MPYKDPIKKREADVKYRKKNHDKILEKQREKSKENPDYQKEQYAKHSENWNQNRREKYQKDDEFRTKKLEQSQKTRKKYGKKYNRTRGLKLNPDYQPRPDRSNFVCECGSTEHNTGGYCKSCAHRELGYGKKYEKTHEKERKVSRSNNPQWQKTANENYSKKMCEALQMTTLEIAMKWRKTRNDCKRRDDFTCQACGYTKYLQVHHIYPKIKYPKLFFDMGTLITFCKKCHDIITYKKFNKKYD
jgi:5-methylcytosine-specific restriction endonuclease McrA